MKPSGVPGASGLWLRSSRVLGPGLSVAAVLPAGRLWLPGLKCRGSHRTGRLRHLSVAEPITGHGTSQEPRAMRLECARPRFLPKASAEPGCQEPAVWSHSLVPPWRGKATRGAKK